MNITGEHLHRILDESVMLHDNFSFIDWAKLRPVDQKLFGDIAGKLNSSQMTAARAREILSIFDLSDNKMFSIEIQWPYYSGWGATDPSQVQLNGQFTIDQLEAIAWWMRNMGAK